MLRLTGDSDLSNRLALAFCVADLREDCAAQGLPMTIDASALRFADRAIAELLLQSAQAVPGLTVRCSPQLRFMIDILDGGSASDLIHGDGSLRASGGTTG
ncbi:hypothetical protein KZZ52_28310 [Dactylosporangium sp. AC04546]|uniref:hypothetical protein n=1 Tax=Dactylosporangium sp. AC04546 TaxID=2862460 RepID=UPI001EE02771|nr:hypothetical protein [Dactylosporangium sp. AC04546]WVK89173.1 hypothetical protein KZZ52_28310 [Dactylosporangium sp. AC04546]